MTLTLISPPPLTFGQAGRDFYCDGVPASPDESALLSLLWRRWPDPPPPQIQAHFLGSKSDKPGIWADVGATRFVYYALTQGYGPFAEMAAIWLVGKKTPTTAECMDLVRHCEARLRNLDALYTVSANGASAVQLLAPRTIYPVVEPSEKADASFALGSALAASVADQCFASRGHGALYRIYHLRLVSSADFCAKHVTVKGDGRTPDYIALVAEPEAGVLLPHIIEAKGGATVNYTEVVHGIVQAQSVDTIAGAPPATRNVSVTTHWTPAKSKSLVLTHMLWVRHPTELDRARAAQSSKKRRNAAKPPKGADPTLLDGMYLVSMSCFFAGLRAAHPTGNQFIVFESSTGVRFALERRAHETIQRAWERFAAPQRPGRNQLGRLLREFGREMYELRRLDSAPPDGSDRWKAVEGYWMWMQVGRIDGADPDDGPRRNG